jgi:hypothetical protein
VPTPGPVVTSSPEGFQFMSGYPGPGSGTFATAADLAALSGTYAPLTTTVQQADVRRAVAANSGYSSTAAPWSALALPPPLLDLDYARNMALAGVETFTRSTSDTYTDAAGISQTAAINAAAFDRRTILNGLVPVGLKALTSGTAMATFNPATLLGLLPANEYTIVLDVDRPASFTGNGAIFSLDGGSTTNRIEIGVNSNYQPYFVVQTAGSVVVNAAPGAIQNWYGGPRRIVMAIKANAFTSAFDGNLYSTTTSGSPPAVANLANLRIGGTINSSSYFTGWVRRARILPVALTQAQAVELSAGDTPLALWGDSFTAGTGATTLATSYAELMRNYREPHVGVFNGGTAWTSRPHATTSPEDSTRSQQGPHWDRRENYYRGRQDLPFAPEGVNVEYMALREMAIANWLELAMNTPIQRLRADGFRTGRKGEADEAAWNEVWQPNKLDARQRIVYTQMMVHGRGLMSVWPNARPKSPIIRPENGKRVHLEMDPEDPFTVKWAVKTFTLSAAPPGCCGSRRTCRPAPRTSPSSTTPTRGSGSRSPGSTGSAGAVIPGPWELVDAGAHTLGSPPFVPFDNKLDADGVPQAGITPLIPAQDAINTIRFNTLLAMQFSAFRQRVFVGYDPVVRDDAGKPVWKKDSDGAILLDKDGQPMPVLASPGPARRRPGAGVPRR